MLSESSMLRCNDTPMCPNLKLLPHQSKLLDDQEMYKRLVRNLNYLTITWQDIAYLVSIASQFTSAHMNESLV